MTKTNVYLLVPTYAGVTGTVQAAFDFASQVDPNGPIQFHLDVYDEKNPKHRMKKDEGFRPEDDIVPSPVFNLKQSASYSESIDLTYAAIHEELAGNPTRGFRPNGRCRRLVF